MPFSSPGILALSPHPVRQLNLKYSFKKGQYLGLPKENAKLEEALTSMIISRTTQRWNETPKEEHNHSTALEQTFGVSKHEHGTSNKAPVQ